MKTILTLILGLLAWPLLAEYVVWPGDTAGPVPGADRLPQAELRNLHGAGTPLVNGEAVVRIGIASTSDHGGSLAEKVDCGMRLVKTRALAIGGPAMREESYGELDWSIAKILDAIPDAWIVIRLNIQPTREFLDSHPGSWVTGANGEQVFQERFNRYFLDVPQQRPSWASLNWRRWCDAEIRALVAYIAAQPYAGQIIGINFSAGHTGEFDHWFGGEGWPGGNGGDWSADSLAHFRQWLRDAYGDDVQHLRQAWCDDEATFDTVAIPGLDAPRDPATGFTDAAAHRAVVDYRRFHGAQPHETIVAWCRSAKEASGGRLLCGAMWAVGDGGHRHLITSPYVDFGSGPGTYFYREPGNHRRLDFTGENLRRHGKWFFEEMDMRTLYYGGEQFAVETLEKTLSVLQRTHAQITTEGVGGYWYEFRSATYRHPAIWRLFRRQAEISELAARESRAVPAEIAVLFSEDSGAIGQGTGDLRTNVLSRLGAPYHTLHLETLVAADPATLPYKLYLFMGTPTLTTTQRDFLRRHVQANGAWIVAFRPAGAWWPEADTPFTLANSTAFHGIGLAPKQGDRRQAIMTAVADNPVGLPAGAALADPADDIPRNSRPTAWTRVDDADAIPLATWPDGQVAAALKRHDAWTGVYVSSLRVSAPFLRNLVAAAGVHSYLPESDDVVYAGGKLLNIHTRQEGMRRLELPQPADLYDLYEERFVGRGQQAYEIPMAALSNHLYYLGDPQAELAEIREALDQEILARLTAVERRQRQRLEAMTQSPPAGPLPLLANGKLRHWLFLGPLELPDQSPGGWLEQEEAALPAVHLADGAPSLRPAPFKRETATTGETLAWRPLFTGGARFYAADFYEEPERRLLFYLAIYLQSETGGTYNLHLRTERGHHLYLDGDKIGQALYQRKDQPLDFAVTLQPGRRHLLLAKVFSAGGGNTGWWAKLTTAEGQPATDVQLFYQPPPEGDASHATP